MAADTLAKATRMSNARRAAAEETFLEVRNLIRQRVWKLSKKYGGDFEELFAEASVIFIAAYESYPAHNPPCGFTTWLTNQVYWGLEDELRGRVRTSKKFEPADPDQIQAKNRDWEPASLLEELGSDARMVVELVIETPAEIDQIIRAKGGEARNVRSTIRDHLRGIGWTAARIAESFCEIRHALAE